MGSQFSHGRIQGTDGQEDRRVLGFPALPGPAAAPEQSQPPRNVLAGINPKFTKAPIRVHHCALLSQSRRPERSQARPVKAAKDATRLAVSAPNPCIIAPLQTPCLLNRSRRSPARSSSPSVLMRTYQRKGHRRPKPCTDRAGHRIDHSAYSAASARHHRRGGQDHLRAVHRHRVLRERRGDPHQRRPARLSVASPPQATARDPRNDTSRRCPSSHSTSRTQRKLCHSVSRATPRSSG